MTTKPIDYIIYGNILNYLGTTGYRPTSDDGGEYKKKDKDDFVKTLQFYSYIKIKAVGIPPTEGIVYVFFIGADELVSKSSEFRKLLNVIPEKDVALITVSRDGIRTPVKKFLHGYNKKTIYIKDLRYDQFKIDPRRSVMVPKHSICSDDEVAKLVNDGKIEHMTDLPFIRHTETQVLWIGGKPGQVVKIERPTDTGIELYYRVVV
jgi:DNA-directed RNA polymerase subunit H (RpoH/RPB5)